MVYSSDRKWLWKEDHSSVMLLDEDAMKKFWTLILLLAAALLSLPLRAATLPFLQDDFAKAQSLAKQRKAPIFVECWAPW